MTDEIVRWIIGVSVVPAVAFGVYLVRVSEAMKKDVTKLLDMHEHPENTGFGTVGLNGVMVDMKEVVEDNTRAIRALTHYVRWLAEKTDGKPPPPPIGDA